MGRATDVLDDVDEMLGEASGDQWLVSSGGRLRLKIGVTTRAEPSTVDGVKRVLEDAGLLDRSDSVTVVWGTNELEAAQARANEQLRGLAAAPWHTQRDPDANSVVIVVPDEPTAEQLEVVEAAVRAAAVAVRVQTGAAWARALSA